MSEDPFETVAIAYSQSQADVMLSMFAWHGIPAYARNIEHARANPPLTLALGGFPIRVYRDLAEEARGLLVEVAEREPEPEPEAAARQPAALTALFAVLGFPVLLVMLFTGCVPQPKVSAEIVR